MFKEDRNIVTLYHGSPHRVERPTFGEGREHNDFGRGFYCTESRELACEWACPTISDGYANCYTLQLEGLQVVNLESSDFETLNWLALLVENRALRATTPLMKEAKDFLLRNYLPDLTKVDIVSGYRADDSYFSFARAFLDGRLSLSQLEQALRLGGLGTQVMVKSRAAFDALSFVGAELSEGAIWSARRRERDRKARRGFASITSESRPSDGIYILDLVRGGA